MNVIDIILAVLILMGLVRGFMRGLFVELAALIALIAGIYGAIHFSHFAATFLLDHVSWEERYINVVAFAITFIIIVLVITLAGRALTKLADFTALGLLNKILGALFGGLKISLILSILIMVIENLNSSVNYIDESTKANSALYEPVRALGPAIFPTLIKAAEEIEENIEDME